MGRRRQHTSGTLAAGLRHLLLLRHPACRPMAVLTAQSGSQFHAAMALPAELQRLVLAFDSLPPMVGVTETPLILGAWCCNTPLWGNPFLPNAGAPERQPWLEHYHLNLSYCRRLTTIGDLAQMYDPATPYDRRSAPHAQQQPALRTSQVQRTSGHRTAGQTAGQTVPWPVRTRTRPYSVRQGQAGGCAGRGGGG